MRRLYPALIITLMLCLVATISSSADAAQTDHKKVLIIINDYMDTSDLIDSDTPNLNALVKMSGTGLINVRAKNKVPASSYMSLASGVRVATAAGSELAFNSGEAISKLPNVFENSITPTAAAQLFQEFTGKDAPANGVVNLFIEPAITYAGTHNPIYVPGQLGTTARQMHLKMGVLGNADTRSSLNRSAAVLAMDDNGIVPLGNVGSDLLEPDPTFPGGLRTNPDRLIKVFKTLMKSCDIMVVDMGDTARVESSRENCANYIVARQRQQALARNDYLLGQITKLVDLNKTMIIMLTPNANMDMIARGNFSLTPILVYKPGAGSGLLESATTRRPGLVSNIDLLPTITGYFDKESLPGQMNIIKTSNNGFKIIDEHRQFYERIRNSRNPLHYSFMLVAALMMLLGFLVHVRNSRSLFHYLDIAIFSTLSIPLVFLFLGYTAYRSLPLTIFIALLSSFLVAFIVRKCFKPETALMLLTALTAILVAVDCFRGSPWMLISPLGSDAIAGGRYYGIGNDYMGILLATTIISSILIFSHFKKKTFGSTLLSLTPLIIATVAIGSPQFGANVGGLITAVVCMGIYFISTTQTKITLKRFVLIVFTAVLVVLVVAGLDARFSSNPSHAGKAINSLLTGGSSAFLSIVTTKLGILAGTVVHSSWTIILILALAVLLITKIKNPNIFVEIAREKPAFSQIITILGLTTLVLFPVKDTGVIAAAFIMLYLLASMWIARYNICD